MLALTNIDPTEHGVPTGCRLSESDNPCLPVRRGRRPGGTRAGSHVTSRPHDQVRSLSAGHWHPPAPGDNTTQIINDRVKSHAVAGGLQPLTGADQEGNGVRAGEGEAGRGLTG